MPTRLPESEAGPDFRSAMQQLIATRWEEVWTNLPRVLDSNDPKHLHELRVASRRLRAAMDVGAGCFPVSVYRPLHKSAKRITSATGEVRDCDVQLKALRGARKKGSKEERIAIAHLVDLMRSRRDAAREEMERFLHKLDQGGSRKKTRRLFLDTENGKRQDSGPPSPIIEPRADQDQDDKPLLQSRNRIPKLDPDALVAVNAGIIVAALTANLFRLSEAIPDAARVDELHDARIAAKRLRYSIELFPEVFGDEGNLALDQLRAFQEEAGKVHDLDVRLQLIAGELRSGARPGKRKQRDLRDGLLEFLRRTQTTRDERHNDVAAAWRALVESGLEARLHSLLDRPTNS